jgi:hypothetical protein
MDEVTLVFRDAMISFFKQGYINPWDSDGNNTWGKVLDEHKIQMVMFFSWCVFCLCTYTVIHTYRP